MSYLVLARKYRPQTFQEVVGQKPVVRTLQNALKHGKVAQALIFSGVRGTGKTTLARIMARALNCEQRSGSIEPCNTCPACTQALKGDTVDLQEVDGASNRGIQEIRELKENIRFMPTGSRYRIIIIDEVHMLTTEAFNALLKTLEEPPAHVYFMFATTELHKVPITILSRCQRYELKRLARKELKAHFLHLAKEEEISIEDSAVDMIVREARGSVRDGLSLLDQVFAYCGEVVSAVEVADVLGLVDHRAVATVGENLLRGNLQAVYGLLAHIYDQGVDIKRLSADILAWFRALLLCTLKTDTELDLGISEDERAALYALAEQHSCQAVSTMFSLLVDGFEQAHRQAQPRLGFELALLKAAQVSDIQGVTELIGTFDKVLAGVRLENIVIPTGEIAEVTTGLSLDSQESTGSGQDRLDRSSNQNQQREKRQRSATPSVPVVSSERTGSGRDDAPLRSSDISPKASSAKPAQAEKIHQRPGSIQDKWQDFLHHVQKSQPWVASSLKLASQVEEQGNDLILHYMDKVDCAVLTGKKQKEALQTVCADFFHKPLQIRFVLPEREEGGTGLGERAGRDKERKALAGDPLVQTALEIFSGQVTSVRVTQHTDKVKKNKG